MFGGDITKPMLFEALNIEAGLTKFIDDIVTKNNESVTLAQSVRAMFDRATRGVSGKVRLPYSSAVYTANQTINDEDKAFQSRMLTICFKPLRSDAEAVVEDYYEWRKLFSCLMPDFQMLGLVDGQVDKYAVQDWSLFLHKAIGKTRDRNINDLAKLGNMMTLLNTLFMDENWDNLFDFMIHATTRATFELSNHAGELDRFVIAILDIEDRIGVNPLGPNPEKVLFHHNMRRVAKPQGPFAINTQWRAFHLGKVVHVIKVLTGKEFKESEVLSAARDSGKAAVSKCNFYDLMKGPWPIKEVTYHEGEGAYEAPLSEERLVMSTLTEQKALFLQESYITQVRKSLDAARVDIDYKQITIKSSKPDIGTYNFYEQVRSAGWHGFVTLADHPFAHFMGMHAVMDFEKPHKEVEAAFHEDCPDGSLQEMYQPAELLEWFTYEVPDICKSWPVCYSESPFEIKTFAGEQPVPKKPRRASPDNRAEYPREPRIEQSQNGVFPEYIGQVHN